MVFQVEAAPIWVEIFDAADIERRQTLSFEQWRLVLIGVLPDGVSASFEHERFLFERPPKLF